MEITFENLPRRAIMYMDAGQFFLFRGEIYMRVRAFSMHVTGREAIIQNAVNVSSGETCYFHPEEEFSIINSLRWSPNAIAIMG